MWLLSFPPPSLSFKNLSSGIFFSVFCTADFLLLVPESLHSSLFLVRSGFLTQPISHLGSASVVTGFTVCLAFCCDIKRYEQQTPLQSLPSCVNQMLPHAALLKTPKTMSSFTAQAPRGVAGRGLTTTGAILKSSLSEGLQNVKWPLLVFSV